MAPMRRSVPDNQSRYRFRLKVVSAAGLVCGTLVVTACGSSAPPTAHPSKQSGGSVNVLYAGSLVNLMTQQVGPGFKAATGTRVVGFSGGSTALATQIKAGVHQGDVFISAAPSANASLTGAPNGDWETWYATCQGTRAWCSATTQKATSPQN